MTAKGRFIVFEGIDGAGKSTQCGRLYSFICGLNIPAVKLAEPTDGEYGRRIRQSLRSGEPMTREEQIDLFIKDRNEDCIANINPALDSGKTIVMDRYFYSNAAYQGMDGMQPDKIITMNLEQGFPVPDRVYFIDLPAHTAMERIRSRSGEATELFEKESFLARVRENFLSVADDSFLIADGRLSEDEIFDIIKKDYLEKFGIRQ